MDDVDDLLAAPGHPPAVPPPRRRRRRRPPPSAPPKSAPRLVLRGIGVIAVATLLPLAVGLGVLYLVGRRDDPAPVPVGFQAPSELPRGVPLPAGEVVFDSDRKNTFELYVLGADQQARALTADPAYGSWRPRLSPDRRTVLFYRTPATSRGRDPATVGLWAMAADGSTPPVLLRPPGYDGWVVQGGVAWSPGGDRLVMAGGRRDATQLYLTDALGQGAELVAPDPAQARVDPVFTPAGDAVVYVGCAAQDCDDDAQEVYRVPLAGGPAERLTTDDRADRDPAVSPDGSRLAWRTQVRSGITEAWDVMVADATGRGARRLLGDDGVTGAPRWADNATILVHRRGPARAASSVWAIPADSTGGVGGRDLTAGQEGNSELPSP